MTDMKRRIFLQGSLAAGVAFHRVPELLAQPVLVRETRFDRNQRGTEVAGTFGTVYVVAGQAVSGMTINGNFSPTLRISG